MKHGKSQETASYRKVPFIGGSVEMLRAHYVTQTFSRHFHEEYAVGFIEQGAMGFRYRGADLVASRGTINLVVPGEAHDGHAATQGGWVYRMFYLPPEVLQLAARELRPDAGQPHFRKGVLEDGALGRAIRETHMILEQGNASSLEQQTRLLRLLVNWINRHGEERPGWPGLGNEHRAVRLAREYMQDNPAEDVGLDTLARLGNLSPFHFLRVFERDLGITPHAYLMQARVNRAKKLLAGSLRLADVAAECGFSDQSHLTRLFRRQFGITPGKYRNFIQNTSD